MAYQVIDDAHHELVEAVKRVTKPGYTPIPITVVSVTEGAGGQMVVFDGQRFEAAEIVKRLRLAADFVEQASAKERT